MAHIDTQLERWNPEDDALRIFIPEHVPLDNKGEEAIIRGYGDTLFPGREVRFTVLDPDCRQPFCRDGIQVWPMRWFYPMWRTRPFVRSLSPKHMVNSACSIARHLLEYLPRWVDRPTGPVKRCGRRIGELRDGRPPRMGDEFDEAMQKLLSMDMILTGHDGGYRVDGECHVVRMLLDAGFTYGVFGVAMPIPSHPNVLRLFARTFAEAKYIYTRNPLGIEWARQKLPDLDVKLAPDPAFGMQPASLEELDSLVGEQGLTDFLRTPVVMMTVCETQMITRYGFRRHATAEAKARAHTELLAGLVTHLLKTHDINVLFLPHCIGPTPQLDDRVVARKIMANIPFGDERVRLIEKEYGARVLKALISRADMVVGERIHSLIGATGVHTPFVCIGATSDLRCQGLIGGTCEAGHAIYCLEEPDLPGLIAHVENAWLLRETERQRLTIIYTRICRELETASARIVACGLGDRSEVGARDPNDPPRNVSNMASKEL